jgi:hypothetical protein
MERIEFREPDAYKRMKSGWNGTGQFYTLKDSPEIVVLDQDPNGFNIYGRESGEWKPKKRLKKLF